MFKMRAKMISVGLLGTAAMLPLDFAMSDQVGHASWYSLPANTRPMVSGWIRTN